MPKDVSREFLQQTFGVTEHKARRAKQIQGEHGLLSTSNPKPGKRTPKAMDKLIKQFYELDHISRQMSGRKDCISMMVNGKKEKVQKRQILCTVYEAYLQLKDEYQNTKLGFSKFAEARPKNVVLPGKM